MVETNKNKDRIPEVIGSLRKGLGNPITRHILQHLSTGDALEKALSVFAGTEPDKTIRCRFHSFLLGTVLKYGARKLDVDEDDMIEYFEDRSVQRGIANLIRGIAEYGVTKPQNLHAPFLVVWDYTRICNLKCKHCYARADKLAHDELTTDQRKEVVDQLYDAGVAALSFSGGEPLMQKDFFEIASYASSKHMYVTVATNGTLITKEVARKMKECGVKYAETSFDGPHEVHDEIRGMKGTFEKSLAGLRNCIDEGIMTGMAMTVMRDNVAYVPEMVDLARDTGVDRFIAFNFIPVGYAEEVRYMDLSGKEREEVLKFLYEQMMESKDLEIFSTAPEYARVALEGTYKGGEGKVSVSHFATFDLHGKTVALTDFIGGCGAGRLYCAIEHNGDIQPCVFMPIRVGNVLEDGFMNVWQNSNMLKQLRDREILEGACSSCKYKYICGGCRARAYAYFGDYLASDPGCKYGD